MPHRVLNIESSYSWLEDSIGHEWLSSARQSNHPMKRAWRKINGQENQGPRLSNDVPRVGAFVECIRQLDNFPIRYGDGGTVTNSDFRDQLLRRAQTSTAEFDAAEIEALVARVHSRVFRLPIVALSPRDIPTPDFEIALSDGTLDLECKARTSEPPIHREIIEARRDIARNLWPLVQAAPNDLCLAVSIDWPPDRDAIRSLATGLRERLSGGEAFTDTVAGFHVTAAVLVGGGKEIVTKELNPLIDSRHAPEPIRTFLLDHGVGTGKTYALVQQESYMREEAGRTLHRRPRLLLVHVAAVPDHVKATAECVRSARAQLSPSIPGIVAVRAPDFYTREQFFEFGKAVGSVTRQTARISAIEIWHQAIERAEDGSQHEAWATWWQLSWITNRRARYPIADGFVDRYIQSGEGVDIVRKM